MTRQKKKTKRAATAKRAERATVERPSELPNSFWRTHRKIVLGGMVLLLYVVGWLVASYLMYRRFPDNFQQPNFYAEDGKVFAYNIVSHGFWHALLTTFNGYYIWGIYTLQQAGFIVDRLLYAGQFADLPRSFALVSYGFLGLMATLPAALFRKYYSFPTLLLLGLLVLYVPLRASDYAVVGTIGNLKFAFFYIAFLLLCYRHLLSEGSKKIYFIDFGLLMCAYTDIVTYPLMLFALIRYWPDFTIRKSLGSLKGLLLRNRSFQSLVILGCLMLPQLAIIAIDGVPALPGYLTNGFNYHRLVEIFVSRSYTYGLLFPANKSLDDTFVVIMFLTLCALVLRFAKRARIYFLFGIVAIFLSTYLFVIKRTGVSEYFTGYQSSGPDQFFYPQNWVFDAIIIFAGADLISKFRARSLRVISYVICLGLVVFYLAPNASAYGTNTFMAQNVGNIYGIAKSECKNSSRAYALPIYPAKGWQYPNISHYQLCTTDIAHYQPDTVGFGLEPYKNNYRSIPSTHFTQIFTSPANNLSGIDIYFSTFGERVNSPYNLLLYSASCKQPIATVPIHTHSLLDNAYTTISIPTIAQSKNETYCFTIVPAVTPASPLAIQLSKPNALPEGITTINGKLSNSAIVFALHYRSQT